MAFRMDAVAPDFEAETTDGQVKFHANKVKQSGDTQDWIAPSLRLSQ
jgi:hypothetical protein